MIFIKKQIILWSNYKWKNDATKNAKLWFKKLTTNDGKMRSTLSAARNLISGFLGSDTDCTLYWNKKMW